MHRTHASLSRKAGIDPKFVADQLGHGLGVNLDVHTIARRPTDAVAGTLLSVTDYGSNDVFYLSTNCHVFTTPTEDFSWETPANVGHICFLEEQQMESNSGHSGCACLPVIVSLRSVS
jgi:hypothetical protein